MTATIESPSIEGRLRQQISTGRLVLFVGNGVRRVPTRIVGGTEPQPDTEPGLGPSWQKYMERLWGVVRKLRKNELDFSAFSRLTAPRQAEWFDRKIDETVGEKSGLASILRMHLLGHDLHPRTGVPNNPLLDLVARIALDSISVEREYGVDIITTNVDCAIEQNIAWAAEELLGQLGMPPCIKVNTAHSHTATWQKGSEAGPEIRIWKIHGCLGALKVKLQSTWPETRKKLAERSLLSQEESGHDEFAGGVPTDELWPGSGWHNNKIYFEEIPSVVFSISEYVSLLVELIGKGSQTELPARLQALRTLFISKSILFIGYDLHEVDVDIVVALHHLKGPESLRYALRFRAEDHSDLHEEERLLQMGVQWWPFHLGPLASARPPGELRLTTRHEWRYNGKAHINSNDLREDLENPWRKKLQSISAQEWLEAQQSSLRDLVEPTRPDPVLGTRGTEPRLVIAGLASMWHAFALKNPADMPSRRRVSANLIAVDSEVPGGSGLVPAMVAAATAGPENVGRITFLTNIGKQWSQWEEIEEFCLSAGIDVRPLQGDLDRNAGARTSHVLLYDPHKKERESQEPRQRMIMDVDELVDPSRGGSAENAIAPKVYPLDGLGYSKDLLFADKLVSPTLISGWKGPIVFETGSSGDELLDLPVAPTFWTAGFGSFIRTLVCARLGFKDDKSGHWKAGLPQDSLAEAITQLREDPDLRALVDQRAPSIGKYVALINSFGEKLWNDNNEIDHETELSYGTWIQQQWHVLGDAFWSIMDQSRINRPLVQSHAALGRGILTTLHEAGLMAHFEYKGSRCSTVIKIESEENGTMLRFVCDARDSSMESRSLGPIILKITVAGENSNTTMGEVIIPKLGTKQVVPIAERVRRHTLGAGDTVRGCLAYGLWAWAFEEGEQRPGSMEHILLASCFLASLKSYAGSFVEFLQVVEALRPTETWRYIWGLKG